MNIRELRIDNFVFGQNDPPMRVIEILTTGAILRFDGVDEDYGDWQYDNYELHGIPLTPEILEKCGFEEIISKPNRYRLNFKFHFFDLQPEQDFFVTVLNPVGTIVIKYLHQLQNLYFALTGEELQVNINAEVEKA